MKQIAAYEDKDGHIHRTEEGCKTADAVIASRKALGVTVDALMAPISDYETRKIRLKNELGNGDWIQHNPDKVFAVAKALVALTMQRCESSRKRLSKLNDSHGLEGHNNELSFFFFRCDGGTSADVPLEVATGILSRIRADGREFNQPYFTVCDEKDITGKCLYGARWSEGV